MREKIMELQDIVSCQFQDWHDALHKQEQQIHMEIEKKFNKFDKYFLDEKNIIDDW